jgi:hypothetical protein
MSEPVAVIARATAQQLTDQYGPQLTADVEAALHTTDGRPQQYTDPIAIGGLIVSIASLAWTIYWNLKKDTAEPAPQVIIRTIRLDPPPTIGLERDDRDRIIDAVVTETITHAETQTPALENGHSDTK